MNNTAVVTLIVVSAALTILLILLSIALGYFISILKQVKRITVHAENVAGTMESAASTFEKAASPLAVLKIIGGIINQASKMKSRKD